MPQKRKIRVCFVCPKAYSLFNPDCQGVFGGAEVDVYMISTELAKDAAYEVLLTVADYGQAEQETREGVRILKSLSFNQNPLAGAGKVWKALAKADADIYVIKTASMGVWLTRMFCARHGRRFVYRSASETDCNGKLLKDHPVLGRLFIGALKKASLVLVQNRADQACLKQTFGIDSAVIANGHRAAPHADRRKRTILWAGRSTAVKQPLRFIELAKQFANEPFVMICPRATDDLAYDDLKRKAAQTPNLDFHEQVPLREIETYFAAARVLVNTSDSEGFPNTFIQAAKAGAAILSFAANPDRFLTEHGCGLCADGCASAMADLLQSLLDGDRWAEFGQRGQAYFKTHHDISVLIEQYKTYFNEMIVS